MTFDVSPFELSRLVFLLKPFSGGEVFIEDQALAGGEDEIIIEPGERHGTPPLVVEAPHVFDGENGMAPLQPDGQRAAGGVLVNANRHGGVYWLVGVSA
jgi:hypothetical protein